MSPLGAVASMNWQCERHDVVWLLLKTEVQTIPMVDMVRAWEDRSSDGNAQNQNLLDLEKHLCFGLQTTRWAGVNLNLGEKREIHVGKNRCFRSVDVGLVITQREVLFPIKIGWRQNE